MYYVLFLVYIYYISMGDRMKKRKFERGLSYPDEKVGTKYIVIKEYCFLKGAVVTLIYNDNTRRPNFNYRSRDGRKSYSHYEYWHNLEPLYLTNTIGGKLI